MSWYKMHRGWQQSEFFSDEKYTEREAWEWLISRAEFEPRIKNICGNPVKLERGQLSDSIRYLSEQWQWNKAKTERFIKRLEKWSMISIKSETGQNIITICEYSIYQGDCDTTETQTRQQQCIDRDRSETNNKNLRTKELKKIEVASDEAPPKVLKPEKQKAHRIPPDWICSQPLGEWAMAEGLTRQEVVSAIDQFKDNYAAAAGSKGLALDWDAKFRTWVRNDIKWKK